MPERLLAPASIATLLFLTTTAASAETPSKMNAEQGWSSIARCAQEDTERARHTCIDRVLREAGLLTDQMSAQQKRREFGLDDKAASAATATSAAPAASAAMPPAEKPATSVAAAPAASADPDLLEVQLTKVAKAPNGWLVVTTNDGAVWRQIESVQMPLPPDKGDQMTIRKGQMGGYRCSVTNTHLTFRCARSR